jgi:hypothetical protein
MRHLAPCLLLGLSLCASATAAELDIAVTADPGTVYLERVPAGQAVNFELLFDNAGAAPVDIDRIEVSAFDAQDQLLLRRFVDGNGVRPNIAVLGARTIPAGEKLAVFNPFHEFAAELPIARLHYAVALSNTDGSVRVARELDVRPVAYRNHASLRLPLAGPAINHDGHDFLGHHRRFDVHFAPIAAMGFTSNAMRYSYDFVPVDAAGEMLAGEFADNAAWRGFGQPILAIADGTVVARVADQPDNRRFDPARLREHPMELFGNYLVVDHGHGEFGVYAHAQQGSITAGIGDRVRRGETIARIGASGSAHFPHLHFQLQDGPGANAQGLPSYFDGYSRLLGARKVPRNGATVDTGEIVQAD